MLSSAIRNDRRRARRFSTGKVKLDIPPLVENGNTVPMTVSVDQPDDRERSRQEHPRLQREEPAAEHRQFLSRPASGRAAGLDPASGSPTRQKVIAIARMTDGTFWQATVEVVVTLAACTEDEDLMAPRSSTFRPKPSAATSSTIKTLISHIMETGFRHTAVGEARAARHHHELHRAATTATEIFRADLFPAIAANPFITFFTVATGSGKFEVRMDRRQRYSTRPQSASITVE